MLFASKRLSKWKLEIQHLLLRWRTFSRWVTSSWTRRWAKNLALTARCWEITDVRLQDELYGKYISVPWLSQKNSWVNQFEYSFKKFCENWGKCSREMKTSDNKWQRVVISAKLPFLRIREEAITKRPKEEPLNVKPRGETSREPIPIELRIKGILLFVINTLKIYYKDSTT